MHILAPLSLPLSIYPSLSRARALSLHMLVPEQSQNRELKMLLVMSKCGLRLHDTYQSQWDITLYSIPALLRPLSPMCVGGGARGLSSSCLTDVSVARSRPASTPFIAFALNKPEEETSSLLLVFLKCSRGLLRGNTQLKTVYISSGVVAHLEHSAKSFLEESQLA